MKAIEITEQIILKAEKCASRGLTRDQIAQALGMGERTLYEKQALYPRLAQAIKRGEAKGIDEVANALFENAIKENNVTAQIFYLKSRAKWNDKVEELPQNDLLSQLFKLAKDNQNGKD